MNVQPNPAPRGQAVPSQTPDKLGFFATLRGNGWIGFLSALWMIDLVWIVVSIPVNLGMLRGMTAKTGVPVEPLAGLVLNIWALPALLLFGFAVANPFAWRNARRLAIGGTAFGIVLGHVMSRMSISLLVEAFAFASSFAATNPYAQILLDHDHGKSLEGFSAIPFSWAFYVAMGGVHSRALRHAGGRLDAAPCRVDRRRGRARDRRRRADAGVQSSP